MKLKLLLCCILSSLFISSSATVFASSDSGSTSLKNLGIPQAGGVSISMETDSVGEGRYQFSHKSGNLIFFIENAGSNGFIYTVKYPCGCKLVGGRLEPKENLLIDCFNPELHGEGYGHTHKGSYSIYIYNDDGSLSSVKLFAQSIEK